MSLGSRELLEWDGLMSHLTNGSVIGLLWSASEAQFDFFITIEYQSIASRVLSDKTADFNKFESHVKHEVVVPASIEPWDQAA